MSSIPRELTPANRAACETLVRACAAAGLPVPCVDWASAGNVAILDWREDGYQLRLEVQGGDFRWWASGRGDVGRAAQILRAVLEGTP